MPHLYDDTVPEVDAEPGDDDVAIAKWARQHRTRTGYRFLSAAGVVVFLTVSAIRRTNAEGTGLTAIIAIGAIATLGFGAAGLYRIVTPPPKRQTHA